MDSRLFWLIVGILVIVFIYYMMSKKSKSGDFSTDSSPVQLSTVSPMDLSTPLGFGF